MAITIQGARLRNMSVEFDDQGIMKMSGNYELMSNTGMVLAKQSFNGYSDIKVNPNAELAGLINQAVNGVKMELNKTLGLE